MWDLIVSVPDHCLSFYFSNCLSVNSIASVLRGLNFISHYFAQAANNCRSWFIIPSISKIDEVE